MVHQTCLSHHPRRKAVINLKMKQLSFGSTVCRSLWEHWIQCHWCPSFTLIKKMKQTFNNVNFKIRKRKKHKFSNLHFEFWIACSVSTLLLSFRCSVEIFYFHSKFFTCEKKTKASLSSMVPNTILSSITWGQCWSKNYETKFSKTRLKRSRRHFALCAIYLITPWNAVQNYSRWKKYPWLIIEIEHELYTLSMAK